MNTYGHLFPSVDEATINGLEQVQRRLRTSRGQTAAWTWFRSSPAAAENGEDPRRSRDLRWWRGQDLNLRPSGYEPDELPDCSTPR